jgi:dolichyl-phosphate-mannose--protein O-mannosyl transferase
VLALTMAIGMLFATRAVRSVGEVFGVARLRHIPISRAIAATITAVYLGAVGWNFAYFYPILTGQVITYQHWMDRMWLDVCDGSQKRDQHHESAPCWI